MKLILDRLEEIDGKLGQVDPGDFEAVGSLLKERSELLGKVAAAVKDQPGAGDGEALERLKALSVSGGETYRRVFLIRTLAAQQFTRAEHMKSALGSLRSPTRTAGALFDTEG